MGYHSFTKNVFSFIINHSVANSLVGENHIIFNSLIELLVVITIGAYEYLIKKATGEHVDVSRLFIYYNARLKDIACSKASKSMKDSGCTITGGIETLAEFGTCLESLWPYDSKSVNVCPSDEAYSEAVNHTITEAFQIDVDLYQMKACLAQGFPFVFAVTLFQSFSRAADFGHVHQPTTGVKFQHKIGR